MASLRGCWNIIHSARQPSFIPHSPFPISHSTFIIERGIGYPAPYNYTLPFPVVNP